MNKEVAEFIIYIINEISNTRNLYPSQIYKVLEKTDCINGYLAPLYDVLHTMSSAGVVNDVIEYVKARGQTL